VAGGQHHSLFVKRDGTLWAMGNNTSGRLGLGNTNQRTSPVQVFFQDSANQPTTALVVATLPKMPAANHSLAIAAPGP
jgi:alpha-tubulin suppressor-like RCC1 family protein